FDEMAEEEGHHRTMLFDLYRKKFGDYLPLIRRTAVKTCLQPHAPPEREWLPAPEAAFGGDAPARPRGGTQVRREHGVRSGALLAQGSRKRARRLGATAAGRTGGGRSGP